MVTFTFVGFALDLLNNRLDDRHFWLQSEILGDDIASSFGQDPVGNPEPIGSDRNMGCEGA